MIICVCCVFYLTRAQIFTLFVMFISSFLAFISALAVEALWEGHKNAKLRKQLRRALLDELINIKDTLLFLDEKEIYINPYPTPVWNGASKSGTILCLDKDTNFEIILKFFSSVEEVNMLETKAYEIMNINPQANKSAILKNLIDCRVALVEEIDNVINVVKQK